MSALIFADDRPTSCDDDLYQWAMDAEAMIRNLHTENTALRVTEDNLRQELQECQDQRRAAFRRIEELDAMRAQIGQVEPDVATPGPWFVRRLERDGELRDCFVSAPDCQGFAYDAEILGDDEYRDDLSRKLADCELIVAAVNAYRARALASAPPAPQANKTHVLVPLRMTRAMQDVVSEEDWSWAELLAAAEAVTEDEFAAAEQTEPIMPQAAVMQQKPLTDEQIEAIFAAIPVDKYDGVLSVARAIEAAHNIGEKK